jgi:hypothetical protein
MEKKPNLEFAKELQKELQTYAELLTVTLEDFTKTSSSDLPKVILWGLLGGMICNLTLRAKEICPSSQDLLRSTANFLDLDPTSAEATVVAADLTGASAMTAILVIMNTNINSLRAKLAGQAEQEIGRIMRLHSDRSGPR